MPPMHNNASISKALVVFGADAPGTRESPTNQIVSYCLLVLWKYLDVQLLLLAHYIDMCELAGNISVLLVDPFVP